MPERWNKVSLVVDSNYAERLHSLATDALWLLDSPANRTAAEVSWQVNPAFSVTTFKSSASSPNAACLGILNMIDLHHGQPSGGYSVLEVVGASLDEELNSAISELGFSKFESTAEGFRARR